MPFVLFWHHRNDTHPAPCRLRETIALTLSVATTGGIAAA